MFRGSTGSFDRMLEKATSQLLLEPDWDSILQICDAIRQGDVLAKYAVAGIRKKINQENPHVSIFGLQVLESCVKNCGTSVHEEVATKEFMEFLKEMVKKKSDVVKAKILELIQVWSEAFRNNPSYKVVQDTFHLMKMEGHTFPTLKEADAMFMSEKAPDWEDGECCHRCRVQFSTFQRKHHCRNCGQVFCGKCSSKQSIIPKYGIEREVRVCEACFDLLNKPLGKKKDDDEDLPSEYTSSSLAQQSQTPSSGGGGGSGKSEQEIAEEDELQLAIAISKSEAEAKDKERNRLRSNYTTYGGSNPAGGDPPSTADNAVYAQPSKVATTSVLDTSDMDPELARYLNRNYWEQKSEEVKVSTTQPSAPIATSEPSTITVASQSPAKIQESYQNGEAGSTEEEEQFLHALRGSIEIFVNRMKSNSQRGRSIANDSSVQTLFMTINAMHPQLMKNVANQEEMRAYYESLQDKLTQLKDAREALDVLREEHREKRRREQEELERQRAIQMAHKLEILRQKKQEYLEYQRQLALQRMQEQEREMQMRLEQQKQMQQMRAMQYAYPQMYGPPGGVSFSPGGSAEGSPLHQAHAQGPPGAYSMPAQPGMAMPGAAPGGPASMGMPAAGQVMYTQGMPAMAVPSGAAPANTAPPPPQYTQPPPGGYQPPQGVYNPAAGAAQPASMQQQPTAQQGYTGVQQSMDYGAYNMQSMNNALPPQGGQAQGPPGQPPQGYINQPQSQYMPPAGQPPVPDQQQQQPQPPPQPNPSGGEASLISFD